jgi:hypothetical protein
MIHVARALAVVSLLSLTACAGKVAATSTTGAGNAGGGSSSSSSSSSGSSGSSSTSSPATVLQGDFSLLAFDATDLYATGERGGIVRISKSDPTATPVQLAADENEAAGLAVDATYIYWSRLVSGEIVRMPKTGGAPEVIASGQVRPWAVAVDDARVYWAAEGNAVAGVDTPTGGQIASAPKAGGAITIVAPNEQRPTTLVLDGGMIYFGDGPWGDTNGAIKRVPKTGGAVQTLASGLDILWTVAVANGYVAWTEESGFSQVAIAGGAPVHIDGTPGTGLASDGTRFYYGRPTNDGVDLVAVAAGDSNPVTIGSGSIATDATRLVAEAVAVDASRVFWLDYSWSYAAPDETSTLRQAPHE